MTVVSPMLTQMASMLMMALVGWVCVRIRLPVDDASLSTLLTKIALPALVLGSLQVDYSRELLKEFGLAAAGLTTIIVVSIIAGFFFAKLLRAPADQSGVWICCIAFANTIFMGKPLMVAMYTDAVLPLIAAFSATFNLLFFILAPLIMAHGRAKVGAGAMTRKIFLDPVVVSSLAALLLFLMPFRLPAPVTGALDTLGSMTTPVSMVIIGMQIAKSKPRAMFMDSRVYLLSAMRLVVAPLICVAVLRLFITDPTLLGTLAICACMPTATIVSVYATQTKNNAEFTSNVTFVSTLLCVFTTPVMVWLFLR